MGKVGANAVLYVVAGVVFLLAALGVTIGSAGELDLIGFGLAAFAFAHIVP